MTSMSTASFIEDAEYSYSQPACVAKLLKKHFRDWLRRPAAGKARRIVARQPFETHAAAISRDNHAFRTFS